MGHPLSSAAAVLRVTSACPEGGTITEHKLNEWRASLRRGRSPPNRAKSTSYTHSFPILRACGFGTPSAPLGTIPEQGRRSVTGREAPQTFEKVAMDTAKTNLGVAVGCRV
eukprot:817531-Pyramimonas_sp.AAC.2